MTKRKEAAPAAEQQAQPEEAITAYKAFDADWKCRGMQYEVGKTFEHTGVVKACEGGLHSCERPLDVLSYYSPNTSRFAVVRASGSPSRHDGDSKVASAKLMIEAEIGIPALVQKTIEWVLARCTPEGEVATGYSGAAMASGRHGRAMGTEGCAIFLVYRDSDWKITHAKGAVVGQDGIKPDTWYSLDESGDFIEVQP